MVWYLINRLAQTLLSLWLIVTVLFIALRLTGDPATQMAGADASVEQIEAIRRSMGLDRPILLQYAVFLRDLVTQGSFGLSYRRHTPVEDIIAEAFPYTLVLAVGGMAVVILLSIPAGIVSALKRNTWVDTTTVGVSAVLQSIPGFWLGLIMIMVFAVTLQWLPSGGSSTWLAIIMPVVAMSIDEVARLMRLVRSSLLDVVRQDYIRTARAKGLPESTVIYRHALRNSLIPPVTFAGLQWARMLAGAVVVERVFSWPGIGQLLLDGLSMRDYPLVMGSVFYIALMFILVNFLVDLIYAVLDPRIKT